MRTLPTLAISLLCLILTGCLETGVGDPATSKIDPRLNGLWRAGDEQEMLLVKPWDQHTYVISGISRQTGGDGVERFVPTTCYRAWLTEIAGKTFITLDESPQRNQKVERPYVIASVEVRDGRIIARGLDVDFAKAARTPADMEKHIRDNIANPKLFTKDDAIYQRVPDAIAAMVK